MENESQRRAPMHGAVSQRAVGAATSVVVFLVGVVMIVDNYRLGAGWAADGPQSGYFPLRIGVILCLASAVILYRELAGRQDRSRIFVTFERLRPVLAVLVPTALYVGAIQLVGIYVASAIFIAYFMRAIGEFGWLRTTLVSVGVSVVLFWLFEVEFLVPLPKGPLEAMFGY